MDTWGTRGFSAAAITGGLLGLSLGMKTVGSELQGPGDRPNDREAPAASRHAGMSGGCRYGAPSAPATPLASDAVRAPERSEEFRASEQTMISPLLSDPSLDVPSGRHGAPADHLGDPLGGQAPTYGSGYRTTGYRSGFDTGQDAGVEPGYQGDQPGGYGADLGSGYRGELEPAYPRGGHAGPDDGSHGSDGFLAGNLAALPDSARSTPEWPSALDAVAPRSHQMGQPTSYPAERPVRSVELVGAGRHGAGPAGPLDEEASALGSLDRSALFGTLGHRYG
jgi:hypothetical protein